MFASTIGVLSSCSNLSAASSCWSCSLKCSISSGCVSSSSVASSPWNCSKWWISYSYSISPWWPGPNPRSGNRVPAEMKCIQSPRVITPVFPGSKSAKTSRTACCFRSSVTPTFEGSSRPYVFRTSSAVQTPEES